MSLDKHAPVMNMYPHLESYVSLLEITSQSTSPNPKRTVKGTIVKQVLAIVSFLCVIHPLFLEGVAKNYAEVCSVHHEC